MNRRRVKITGLGFVTPAGIGKQQFLHNIQESVSRVVSIARLSGESAAFVGAEVGGFQAEKYLAGVQVKRRPRHTQFALAGAKMAVADAGLTFEEIRDKNPLVMIGAALMDFGSINKGIDLILRQGPSRALPTTVSDVLISSIGEAIVDMIGGAARSMAFQSACCSGLDAIGRAADLISQGEAELAICGGTEAPLHLHPMLELRMAGLAPGNPMQPERQSRPFDRWRTTGVIGEGACIMVLESESSPRKGYAYVGGHGYASDCGGKVCSGLSHAIRLALGNASMRATDVEAISAWGPGHRVIDEAEARVLIEVFGSNIKNIPAYSIKGAIGNPLGAAAAIQVGCAALGVQHGIIPPTVNWSHPDPACPLNLSMSARYIAHDTAIISAHGLSGTNSCLVISR